MIPVPSFYEKTPLTFAEWLERLHALRHTGPVTIHFAQGQPNALEMPSAAPTVYRVGKALDKRRRVG